MFSFLVYRQRELGISLISDVLLVLNMVFKKDLIHIGIYSKN